MPRVDDEHAAEKVAKDNASELIVKKYSMKLRWRTIILFIVILCVIFIILGAYVGTGWQSIFNQYEDDVALANGRTILNNLADEVNNLRVRKHSHPNIPFHISFFIFYRNTSRTLAYGRSAPKQSRTTRTATRKISPRSGTGPSTR